MPQPNRYQPLIHQLEYLEAAYHLHICVKDYVGFIPIDKELSAAAHALSGAQQPLLHVYQAEPEPLLPLSEHDEEDGQQMPDRGLHLPRGVLRGGGRIRLSHSLGGKAAGAVTAGFLPMEKEEAHSRHRPRHGGFPGRRARGGPSPL